MKVSVIIPTYNFGDYIAESVESVIKQTFSDLEIIVVDDGSTDDTARVLDTISDPRLVRITIANSGVSVARNTGLDAAQGQYIAFLDADDRWLPTKLEKQLEMFEKEPSLGMVFTNFARFNSDGLLPKTLFDFVPELEKIPAAPVEGGAGYVIATDTFSALASTNEMATWLQTILFRADLAGDLRFPPGVKLCEDFHYMVRMYERVNAGYIKEPLVEVRRHDANSYTNPSETLEPKAIAISTSMQQIKSASHKRILQSRLGRAWAAVGYYHYWNGNVAKSACAYIRALFFKSTFSTALKHIVMLPLVPMFRLKRNSGTKPTLSV